MTQQEGRKWRRRCEKAQRDGEAGFSDDIHKMEMCLEEEEESQTY